MGGSIIRPSPFPGQRHAESLRAERLAAIVSRVDSATSLLLAIGNDLLCAQRAADLLAASHRLHTLSAEFTARAAVCRFAGQFGRWGP